MTNYFRKPDALVDAVRAVLSGQPNATQEAIKKEDQLDPVDPKALKGKHKDRKDKDIDNDGDVDSSDKYLHKRRQAVSKAMKEEVEDNPANTQHLCAKNVVHESWGEGSCIPTMHADPDEDGNIEWYDVMFDHGIEEQVSIEELKVTKAESHTHSKKKIKESKDEDDDDDDDEDDDDDDDEDDDDKKKKVGKKGKKDEVDTEPSMDDQTMTAEMSDKQMKKREEIVKSMKKKSGDFKKRYGDRAKDVMYATATKMATKEGFEFTEEELEEMTKPPFDGPYRKVGEPRKDKFGNVIKPKNVAKHLAKKAMASVTKEEVELDEKPADFIRLSFSSPADVKKAKKWMDQNLPGANQGFTGMDASGKDIEFEGVDDAEDLMAKLKKAGFKFKMDYREEVELDGKD